MSQLNDREKIGSIVHRIRPKWVRLSNVLGCFRLFEVANVFVKAFVNGKHSMKTKREKLFAEAGFLESLIHGCVLESYFPKEAESTQLNFKCQTLNLLGGQLPNSTNDLQSFLNTANAPRHPIRNQLIGLTSSSPELFGVIKEEGRV